MRKIISKGILFCFIVAVLMGAQPLSEQITITDLGTLGGRYSGARCINNLGQVVGESDTASGYPHATLWAIPEKQITLLIAEVTEFTDKGELNQGKTSPFPYPQNTVHMPL